MSDKLDESIENEVSVDLEKRKFMSKFGKYAVVGVGMAALMTPNASASFNSGCKPRTRRCGGSQSRPKWSSRKPRSQRRQRWAGHKQGPQGNRQGNPHRLRP